MKRFFEVVAAVKERAALNYTAAMCCWMFFLFVFQWESVTLPMLFSMLLACVVSGVMQVVAFTNLLFKKMAYGWRMALFCVAYDAILTAFAVGFGWFPADQAGAWVLFAVIFVLIFAAIAVGIEIHYRASGRKWDDRLDWYRRRKEK